MMGETVELTSTLSASRAAGSTVPPSSSTSGPRSSRPSPESAIAAPAPIATMPSAPVTIQMVCFPMIVLLFLSRGRGLV
ncbi:hypothetical protein [Demequina activiva]|uniref:hypothetical protein n=1 Tax=Demequina activiva TaxID=1582364 RepID=UPI00194259D8|nr:hypothetical protein [Demequina activiva]